MEGNTQARVEALRIALRDEDSHIRFWAALALAELGGDAEAALPDLRSLLEDPIGEEQIFESFVPEDVPARFRELDRPIRLRDTALVAIESIEAGNAASLGP